MNDQERMLSIDRQIAHVWMVRTFLKHSDEAVDDEELAEVHRGLYDFCLAVGPALRDNDAAKYLKLAAKKWTRLRDTTLLFKEIQPEVSGHMNYKMAATSLIISVNEIANLLDRERLDTD